MKEKLMKFMDALEDYGEFYFSNGSIKKDYEHVTSILDAQGFWSGIEYRFYFDKDLNLTKVENRY